MKHPRLALLAGIAPMFLLAACQSPVRPDLDEAEPETPVTITPVPPIAPAEPAPPPTPALPDPMDTGAEVFDRMSARFSAPVCVKGQHNRSWRKRYAGYPASFARHMEEILPLMAYVVEEIERRNLPGEFALIPIVESWYRPAAIGPGGPAGMWQMISSTARNHGIRIQQGYDGRLSPVESTDAALSYLQTLDGLFDGEWRTMAMAYNAGEYRIIRAFRASGDQRVSGERHLPRGLSRTTYDYVAKLHALSCLIAKPDRHGLVLPRDTRFVPLARMTLPAGVNNLDQAAAKLGTDAARLRALNPAYRQGRIVAGAPRDVLAPVTSLALLASLTAEGVDPGYTGDAGDEPARTHIVRRGDSLSRIANRYGVPLKQIYSVNRLTAKSVIRPGQVIQLDP